ncbi:hypothetical protein F442_17208 [Phytophthora nicotianae P10297]|uniref:RxLR effector protein n=1 Tax=Phytophthora nicotianae P10297 TaxID=1317064 RepID=W2YHQ0_PHYNI|nr:hypothetical protein F442_17208 [Phytophthora nicotianae P10297]
MLWRLLLLTTALAILAAAEPLQNAPYTPTDNDSIYTTLSDNGPMAGTGPRRLEPLPTASAEERSDTIYTTLTHDSPMAGMGPRRLEPLPSPSAEEQTQDIYTLLSDDGPMAGMGPRTLRQ